MSLAVCLGVAAVSWWALLRAYRTNEIYYRGDTWSRRKNPVIFWMTVTLCVFFGIVAPISFIAVEGADILRSVQEMFG